MDALTRRGRGGWEAALEVDQDCLVARLNRDLVEAEISLLQSTDDFGELKLAPAPMPSPLVGAGSMPSSLVGEGGPQGRMGGPAPPMPLLDPPSSGLARPPPYPSPMQGEGINQAGVASAPLSSPVKGDRMSDAGVFGAPTPLTQSEVRSARREPRPPGAVNRPGSIRPSDSIDPAGSVLSPRSPGSPVRVATLSFLFNWPSTGAGYHHTAEMTRRPCFTPSRAALATRMDVALNNLLEHALRSPISGGTKSASLPHGISFPVEEVS